MDDNDELDTIVMQDEDKTLDTKSDEVKEEDDQELISSNQLFLKGKNIERKKSQNNKFINTY